MIITISGPPGSGKSTLSKILSAKLGMELVSMGDIFRKCAQDRCMSLAEFGIIAKCNEDIDRNLDEAQKKIAEEKDNMILEGRLSGFFVDADLKIWLKAPVEVRAQRIAKRENKKLSAAIAETSEREECERERYFKYYNIDIRDLSIYDLVIDSTKWEPEKICEIAAKAVECLL
ncbi:MAG: AAA family ATPase [Candidatus Methanoperedens sp.]|nr:AAA family ATPase [Candidatus Methanoperedens sp.]MCE8425089.1 AAA family ATPase [Candidatus Methanoperedens sp.]MCE8427744.1 AAA family ATPase [Candidatus Methanoperedens sp.]